MVLLRAFYSLCIFLVGAVALVLPRGYSVGFFLACLTALLLWLSDRERLWDGKTKWLIGLCLAIALVHQWAWRSLYPYVPFVLMVLGMWAIRHYKPDPLFFFVRFGCGHHRSSGLGWLSSAGIGLACGWV